MICATRLAVWTVTAGVLVVVAAGSLAAAAGVQDDQRQPGDVEIVAERFDYPDQVVVGPGTDAVFVHNRDRGRHTFVVEGTGVGPVEVPAGSDVRVPIDLAPGTYRFYCSVAGHDGMEGTLTVE